MGLLDNLFGGNQKSADQLRYEELVAEVEPWENEDHNPDDPRNEEMSRKQKEQVELYYKLHPEDRVRLPDDVEVVITSVTIDDLREAVQEKKRGWFR